VTDEAYVAAVRAVRPEVRLRPRPGPAPDDEVVLVGGDEVFRLPRAESAATRHALLVRALPRLRPLLPVAVPAPRWVGVLEDGTTPFLAERRLRGVPLREVGDARGRLGAVAVGQVAGALAALAAVPAREARQWGVRGEGTLLHGALGPDTVLVDPRRGVVTGLVDWDPRLGDPADDLRGLPEELRP
jgi:aminoglycoside phosphotransferase (APT) family kinase protein